MSDEVKLRISAVIPNSELSGGPMIGQLKFTHLGGTEPLGNYKVEALTCDGRHSDDRFDRREFTIQDYDRHQGFWFLVKSALEELTKQLPPTSYYEDTKDVNLGIK